MDSTLIRDIEPQLIIVTQHQHNVVVVSPVTATGSVQISFQYTRDTDPALRYGPVKITVLPEQAAPKPPKPPKPPHGLPA